ncbi:MAG: ShlB/FhaC/HecB family hemolysin secretion/activation protein [Verrucomicrobia bacterium]|nr:ShlB/FhaC/HecB family hemolysin secretion/activation protein [Verrucomicrobiota bacterium]
MRTNEYPNAPCAVSRAALLGWLLAYGYAAAEDGGVRFYIREYRIEGIRTLKPLDVESSVYRFLGPARTPADVEQARQALEKCYHSKGYQTVSVTIPEQDPRHGVIRMSVMEGKVARLHVSGAKWYLPSRIRKQAPSVAEGRVPNLNEVTREMVALNRSADRRITPELSPGEEPGTVDIELKVDDKLPLHGSLELNNRYSPDTAPLRVNGALSYANCFQLGHTFGLGFQLAPENPDDAAVFTAYYAAPVSERGTIMLNATKQDSDISTVGGTNVGGRGEIVGVRWMYEPEASGGFRQSVNLGFDCKNLEEDVKIGGRTLSSPIEYYPIGAGYSAAWLAEDHFTEFNTSLTCNIRGLGSDTFDYANKRYGSSGGFVVWRADLAHTRDFAGGMQWFGKIQGQLANQPLINSEQFSGGGLGTARGYLEATKLGDSGIFGTLEIRGPSLIGSEEKAGDDNEWRFHLFVDAGVLDLIDPLPGTEEDMAFASFGLGTRFQLEKHYHGSLDLAVPLLDQPSANDNHPRITFRGWIDF